MKKIIKMEINTLGDYFRYTMLIRNVSTRDAAKELNMNSTTVWRITRNKNFWPRYIIPIAIWCKLTPRQLWDLLKEDK